MKNRTPFKNNILLITYTALLLLFVLNLNYVISFAKLSLNIVAPVFYGISIAFVLNLLMRPIEEKLFIKLLKRPASKLTRVLSILLTLICFSTLIIFVTALVVPELLSSIALLVNSIPGYAEELLIFAYNVIEYFEIELTFDTIKTLPWADLGTQVSNFAQGMFSDIFNSTASIASGFLSVFMGFVISIYLLADKENFLKGVEKVIISYFPEKWANKLMKIGNLTGTIFNKFVSGQLIEAIILGVLCFIGMLIFKLPYAPLISVIIGITNLIPYFGPFLGTIPCVFLIAMVNPVSALIFILFILALQQIDSNFIYPRIVGDAVELPGIWVIVAISIGGGLFGVVGMLLSVPVFAIIYALAKEHISKKYDEKMQLNLGNTESD